MKNTDLYLRFVFFFCDVVEIFLDFAAGFGIDDVFVFVAQFLCLLVPSSHSVFTSVSHFIFASDLLFCSSSS